MVCRGGLPLRAGELADLVWPASSARRGAWVRQGIVIIPHILRAERVLPLSVIVHVCIEALLIRGENLPLDGDF